MKTERVVVVTGAAGGIGRQIVKKFLDNGYFACMLDIAEEPIAKAIEEMGFDGSKVKGYAIDISSEEKVKEVIVQRMLQYAAGGKDYSGKCYISNSACEQDARDVADLVERTFPKLNGKVLINDVGNLIGSHTGPGTVALFFWGCKRGTEKT